MYIYVLKEQLCCFDLFVLVTKVKIVRIVIDPLKYTL